MDAIQLLEQQHRDAKRKLQQIIETQDAQAALTLWKTLQPKLETHERIEEQFLYIPMAEFCGNDSVLAAWNREHLSEVAQMRADMKSLDVLDASSPNWRKQLQNISDAVSKHIEEEQNRAFPFIMLVWGPTVRQQAGLLMEDYLATHT